MTPASTSVTTSSSFLEAAARVSRSYSVSVLFLSPLPSTNLLSVGLALKGLKKEELFHQWQHHRTKLLKTSTLLALQQHIRQAGEGWELSYF